MKLTDSISNKNLIPFVFAFIAILTFHFFIDLTTDDYKYFRIYAFGYYEQGDVISFLQWRYATWTSRVLIEFFTFWFVQLPTWIFAIADSLIVLAIVVMTYLLFSRKRGIIYATAAILLTFMYRITDQGSAGYLVTMIVYLWPLAAFLPTLFPFKKSLENKESPKWTTYAICACCALFCCNCEQICVAAIMTWGAFTLYTYLQTKQINKLYCLLLLIALANLVFIATCPGNSERAMSEMARLQITEPFSPIKKLALCIASPIAKYMVLRWHSLIVWAFSAILPFTIYIRDKKKDIPLYISMIPLYISMIPLAMLCSTFVIQRPVFTMLQQASAIQLSLICVLSIAFYGSILFSLLYIGKDKKSFIKKYGPTFIFVVGLFSRACLGVTVSFQDTSRTFFLLEYSMIAISILYLSDHIAKWKDKSDNGILV